MNTVSIPKNGQTPGKGGFVATVMPLVMLAMATFLAFFNAWPNKLVFDDKAFAGPGRAPELDSLQYIFTHELWATVGAHTGLYRPLLLLDLSLETRAFGDWLAGYHLSNITLHLLATFLLYGILLHLLRRTDNPDSSSRFYALLAALVFAVHPIHTEVVNSVFNRSEIMVAMFGLGGLWWLLHHLDRNTGRAWFGLGVSYFLGLLSKESAVVIPGLAVVLILLLTAGDFSSRMRKCLPVFWMFLPLALYLSMRAYALSQPVLGSEGQATEDFELAAMLTTIVIPDSSTFLGVLEMFGLSMKVLAWPYPLQMYHADPSTLMLLGYAALHLALIIVAFIQIRRSHYGLAAGLAFFYVALLPASRIIGAGESGSHFAERYLYFPSVGLTVALAFALRALAQRFTSRVVVRFAMPVLLVLTVLTWERNTDWISEVSLFETEYQRGHPGMDTLRLVAGAYLQTGNYARVVNICDENLASQEESGDSSFVQSCATAYENQKRLEEAERAHLFAIESESTRIGASMSLARFYIRHNRRQDAGERFIAAIDWSEDPADRSLRTAEMLITLNPASREQGVIAKGHIEEALRLRPGWPKAETMLKALERALNPSSSPENAGDDSGD